jgi:hypothetical protein
MHAITIVESAYARVRQSIGVYASHNLDRWFDFAILAIVLVNVVQLCMQDPYMTDTSATGMVLGYLSYTFLAAFILEAVLRIVAMGFGACARARPRVPALTWAALLGAVLHPGAYLRSGWNAFDFLLVVLNLLDFLPGGAANLTGLRALRVLRTLRTVRVISGTYRSAHVRTRAKTSCAPGSGMRALVTTLVRAIPAMASLLVMLFMLFAIFGVMGTVWFGGALGSRCVDTLTGDVDYSRACDPALLGHLCPNTSRCIDVGATPNLGAVSFDDMLSAWVVVRGVCERGACVRH